MTAPPPPRCVVDTNVATTANGANAGAPAACIATCARALATLMQKGHLFIDDGGRIVGEYRSNLRASGQPGPGDAFLKWALTYEWGGQRVTRVAITPCDRGDGEDFSELPSPPAGVRYDPSDRKFLAVAAAHDDRPPIWQALDSKWWGWRDALREVRLSVHFLCEGAIARKHAQKMGTRKRQ